MKVLIEAEIVDETKDDAVVRIVSERGFPSYPTIAKKKMIGTPSAQDSEKMLAWAAVFHSQPDAVSPETWRIGRDVFEELQRYKAHAEVVVCSYCGALHKRGADTITAHIMECEKRPEKKLGLLVLQLCEALKSAEHDLETNNGALTTDKKDFVPDPKDLFYTMDFENTIKGIEAALTAAGLRKP